MNESVKLEIPFNENREREHQKFFFQYTWKKGFTELKKAIFYALLFLSLGFSRLNFIQNNPASTVFKYAGVIFIGYIFLLLYQYFTAKKKFHESIEAQINDFKRKHEKDGFIILKEDTITIENSLSTVGSVWGKTSYKFVDKYLIMNMINSNINFVFSETDFKESDYKTFTSFLEQYSKQKK